MNSITLIRNLIDERSDADLTKYLAGVWNHVWSDNGEFNYANLRLYKTIDKIKNISGLGVDFRNKQVLDIGCGDGTTLLYLSKFFSIKGVGIDISDHVVNELRENIRDTNLSFQLGDHRNLKGLANDQFDIVLSFGVIEHFDEYGLAISEARRVLKPGGQLVLIQPHLFSFGVLQEYYLRFVKKWKFGRQKDFSYLYYLSLLKLNGFSELNFSTRPPYGDMKITRVLDLVTKKLFSFWGHYLYLIAKK